MKIGRDRLHLLHIDDAIDKIAEYSKDLSLEEFVKSDMSFDAIVMQIMVIGEAVNSLSDEFKDQHSDMPWHEAVGMRNQIAHGYFDIKPKVVWKTIQENLPELKVKLENMNLRNEL